MTNAEIQVGKFGRTNLGKILIFAYLENLQGERYKNKVILTDGKKIINDFYYFKKDEKIVKESSNLIDLIEAGDYVNGYKVIEPNNDKDCLFDYMRVGTEAVNIGVYKDDIKTIVTKEQFKSMEYKVGGEDDKC